MFHLPDSVHFFGRPSTLKQFCCTIDTTLHTVHFVFHVYTVRLISHDVNYSIMYARTRSPFRTKSDGIRKKTAARWPVSSYILFCNSNTSSGKKNIPAQLLRKTVYSYILLPRCSVDYGPYVCYGCEARKDETRYLLSSTFKYHGTMIGISLKRV